MIRFPEMLSLFYALAGLCVGLLWGLRYGAMAGFGLSLAGCVIGFITGSLVGHLPQEVNLATVKLSHKGHLVGSLFAVSGYLAWLGVSIAFWWVCLSLISH